MTRLNEIYKKEVVPALKAQFGYKFDQQAPRIEKVVLNMGLGAATQNAKIIDSAVDDLRRITGQQPVIRRAKKSIASFKLREGVPIGVSVTLRRERMYEFLDRFMSVALPRVRDFRGVSRKGFDGNGNYSVGITEQMIFPEIDIEKTTLRGLNITIVTSAKTDDEARELLAKLGMPFKKVRSAEDGN